MITQDRRGVWLCLTCFLFWYYLPVHFYLSPLVFLCLFFFLSFSVALCCNTLCLSSIFAPRFLRVSVSNWLKRDKDCDLMLNRCREIIPHIVFPWQTSPSVCVLYFLYIVCSHITCLHLYVFVCVCVCVSSHLFSVGSGPDSQGFVFLLVFWDQEDRYVPELFFRCTVPNPHCLLAAPICQRWFRKGRLFWNLPKIHPHRHWGVSSLKVRSIKKNSVRNVSQTNLHVLVLWDELTLTGKHPQKI